MVWVVTALGNMFYAGVVIALGSTFYVEGREETLRSAELDMVVFVM